MYTSKSHIDIINYRVLCDLNCVIYDFESVFACLKPYKMQINKIRIAVYQSVKEFHKNATFYLVVGLVGNFYRDSSKFN